MNPPRATPYIFGIDIDIPITEKFLIIGAAVYSKKRTEIKINKLLDIFPEKLYLASEYLLLVLI